MRLLSELACKKQGAYRAVISWQLVREEWVG